MRQIIGDRLGMPVGAVEPIVGLGKINAIFRVDSGKDVLIARLQPTDQLEVNYAKEAWCLERAAEAGVPAPTARAHGDIGPYSYIVEDFIEGVPGGSDDIDLLRVWELLGEYAARTNGITARGAGHRMSTSSPGQFLDTWEGWVTEQLAKAFRDTYWVDAGLFPEEHIATLKDILDCCRLVRAPAGLVHTDIGEWNTILGNGDVEDLYLIDWEFAVAAPVPHYQLARAWVNAPHEEAYHAFVRAYGLPRTSLDQMQEDVTALVALELLSGLRWAQDNRPQDVAEDSQSTRRLVYELYGDRLR